VGDEIIEVLEGSADAGGGRVLNPENLANILIEALRRFSVEVYARNPL